MQNLRQNENGTGASLNKTERRRFKDRINYMSLGLLIYTMIIFGVSIGDVMLHYIVLRLTSSSADEFLERAEQFRNSYAEFAVSAIIGVIMGVAVLMLFFIRAVPVKEIFKLHGKMTFTKLIMLTCVLMGGQFVFLYVDEGTEWLLNQVGLSVEQAIETSTAGSTTVSMFLYAGFIGPLAEEIVYRGFVMHTFQKAGCGKVCAIVVSALLFGVMHANPTQSVFAVYVGIVFAYTAAEYGIVWSLALHIINNFLFGDVLNFIASRFSDEIGSIITYAVILALFIAGSAVLIVRRKRIAAYIRENRSPARYYGWAFSSAAMVAFICLNLLLAATQVQRI